MIRNEMINSNRVRLWVRVRARVRVKISVPDTSEDVHSFCPDASTGEHIMFCENVHWDTRSGVSSSKTVKVAASWMRPLEVIDLILRTVDFDFE